jgi:DNA polymerase-3 subunit alpha
MRRFIKELKPTCFGDIAAMVALYRPGPKQHIPTFIRAKHGKEPIRFPHPALEEILRETYGVIVYQDQVLLIVQAFAGYSLGEADIVRKAMGKKIPEVMKKEMKRFLAGAKKKEFTKDIAEQVWSLIEPFAGYAFNKAHSVSYAMIAYQTAYLKANYPVEFMTALLTTHVGQSEKAASAVSECHRLGIKVLPPDVNRSGENFTIDNTETEAQAIRFGLAAIKNVGATAIRPIIVARDQGGPFKSIDDFCRRADLRNINKRALESMIKAGALDSLGKRGSILAGIDRILSLAQTEQRLREVGQSTMFDLWGQSVDVPLPGLELPIAEISDKEKLAWEKELLGTYLSEHPFTRYTKQLSSEIDIFCGQIDEDMVGQNIVTAGIVTTVRQALTRDGRPFVSAVLDDFTGSLEVTAWNDVFERTRDLWQEGNTLLIKGRLKSRGDRIQLTCFEVSLYQLDKEDETEEITQELSVITSRHRLNFNLSASADVNADISLLNQLRDVLKRFPGNDEVYLTITTGDGTTKLEMADLSTSYGPELHEHLVNLIDEQSFSIDEVAI